MSSDKIINPHNPQFLTTAPWYAGVESSGPTLQHQTIQKQQHLLSLNEVDDIIQKKIQLKSNKFNNTHLNIYKKGGCRNCGSMTHKEKDCIERPRSAKTAAWKSNQNIAIDDIQLSIENHGKLSYDAKRDYWTGYDPKLYQHVIEQFNEIEMERLKQKQQQQQQQSQQQSNQMNKQENPSIHTSSDSDDSESEDEKEVISDDKLDYLNVDSRIADFQSHFSAQGGIGGNGMKVTTRNLRIREDMPKYLRNLSLNSAFYDPKSRSMRANPNPNENPENLEFAGDNFLKQSGDALKLAQTQVMCWEMQGLQGEVNGYIGDNQNVVDIIANPSQVELMQREYIQKKKQLEEIKKKALIEKYGIEQSEESKASLDIRLRLGQTEAYVEYSKDGRLKHDQLKKIQIRTKYEEDVYINNHTSVWGSYFHRSSHSWGYACCHSLVKNSYCVGMKGIQTNDLVNNESITNIIETKRESKDMKEEKMEVNNEKRKYATNYKSDVSNEEMEEYRLAKIRREDPMANFM